MSNSKNKLFKIGVKGIKINVSAYARDNNISWSTALKRLNFFENPISHFEVACNY